MNELSANYLPRSRNKRTEVGVIPEDWGTRALGDMTVLMTNGFVGTATTHYASNEDGVLYLQGYNVKENGFDFHGVKYVTEEFHRAHLKSCLRGGDLLTIQTGDVGLTTIVPQALEGSNCHALIISRFDQKKVSPAFISYYLNSNPGRSRLKWIETGTTMKHLNIGDVLQFVVPLPPTKVEQDAIAEALSDADALIESLKRLLVKKRQLKQGATQELLTGKKRLVGFGGKWEVSPLRRFVRQFIVPMRDKPKRFTGEIPWCRIEDFDGMYLTRSKSGQCVDLETVRAMNLKVYPAGTLLVSCSADLGRCTIVARPLVSNQTFIGLEMDEAVSSNLFFYYFMTSRAEELNNLSSGTTISYLSRQQFEEFGVFVPLDRKEQIAIAAILAAMDVEIAALEVKLAKAGQVKQGMMQELLTGRIRLV